MMMRRIPRNLLVLLTLALAGLGWLPGVMPVAEANVTLTFFDVVPNSSNTELTVRWETQSETDMVGFRVKRSETSNAQQAVIAMTVGSEGSATTGAEYEQTDTGLTKGQTYYYWLYELTTTGAENLLTQAPRTAAPGVSSTPTATATSAPVQQTNTPTPTQAVPIGQATNTPTVPQLANLTSTPTATTAPATATFTPPAQATNTPIGATPTPFATNTPVPPLQDQATNTPVAAVSTPIVEGPTPNSVVPTPEVRADVTPSPAVDQAAAPVDQPLQEPVAPTQALDEAASGAAAAGETPLAPTSEPTPQAVAQGTAPDDTLSLESRARPTATPRPSDDAKTSSGASSLLLIFGAVSLIGAVVVALAALVIWRRR